MALFTVVFIVIGVLLAGAAIVEHVATGPRHYGSAVVALANWMCRSGEPA